VCRRQAHRIKARINSTAQDSCFRYGLVVDIAQVMSSLIISFNWARIPFLKMPIEYIILIIIDIYIIINICGSLNIIIELIRQQIHESSPEAAFALRVAGSRWCLSGTLGAQLGAA
jgi:hypothetical protein